MIGQGAHAELRVLGRAAQVREEHAGPGAVEGRRVVVGERGAGLLEFGNALDDDRSARQ